MHLGIVSGSGFSPLRTALGFLLYRAEIGLATWVTLRGWSHSEMSRAQVSYVCGECGGACLKWQGQCPACGAWNTLAPVAAEGAAGRPRQRAAPMRLTDIAVTDAARGATGINELDRVLGGGLVRGSVVLMGGAPGIGKSTLLLQVAGARREGWPMLYVTGEESAEQVALRARRLGIDLSAVNVLAANNVDDIVECARQVGVFCLIVDSIQTMYADSLPAAPGSPNQLRECTARLISLAKATGTAVILVGHVTKEGVIAGPRMLEHMVDAVLYFEDEAGSRFRMLRTVKNRFGAAGELGIFAMGEQGLREVHNPSAIFLSRQREETPGSVVTVLHQGTRPLLVEVQALTDRAGGGPARRLAVGMDPNRVALLLAALHRHAGIRSQEDDVFVNVVGGVRISETAADLALLVAIVSSREERALARDLVVFGEIGLGGEIRPVAYGEERIREAAKLGFTRAVVPAANTPRREVAGMTVAGATRLPEALRLAGVRRSG
jgi:DNA repair protein RadA/Sms